MKVKSESECTQISRELCVIHIVSSAYTKMNVILRAGGDKNNQIYKFYYPLKNTWIKKNTRSVFFILGRPVIYNGSLHILQFEAFLLPLHNHRELSMHQYVLKVQYICIRKWTRTVTVSHLSEALQLCRLQSFACVYLHVLRCIFSIMSLSDLIAVWSDGWWENPRALQKWFIFSSHGSRVKKRRSVTQRGNGTLCLNKLSSQWFAMFSTLQILCHPRHFLLIVNYL